MPSERSFGHKKIHKHDKRNVEIFNAKEERLARRLRVAKASKNFDLFLTLSRQMSAIKRKKQELGLYYFGGFSEMAEN